MRRAGRWAVKGVAMLTAVIVLTAALGVAVMLLWNSLVPGLFHGPTVQYWQALGLLVLSRVLFGGLRGRGGWHGRRRWREHWEQMTPEERARLRESVANRCGRRGDAGEATTAPPSA